MSGDLFEAPPPVDRRTGSPLADRLRPRTLDEFVGHGKGYLHPHDFDEAVVDQGSLPEGLRVRAWYRPSPFGREKENEKRMEWWSKALAERQGGGAEPAAGAARGEGE